MNITKQIESVKKLHGDERAQASKVESYTTWLLRKRAKELGPSVIKQEEQQ